MGGWTVLDNFKDLSQLHHSRIQKPTREKKAYRGPEGERNVGGKKQILRRNDERKKKQEEKERKAFPKAVGVCLSC